MPTLWWVGYALAMANLPIGTVVKYAGSKYHMHGYYTVTKHADVSTKPLSSAERQVYYPNGEAYDLWRLGAPYKMDCADGNRLLDVRRASITVVDMTEDTTQQIVESVIREALREISLHSLRDGTVHEFAEYVLKRLNQIDAIHPPWGIDDQEEAVA